MLYCYYSVNSSYCCYIIVESNTDVYQWELFILQLFPVPNVLFFPLSLTVFAAQDVTILFCGPKKSLGRGVVGSIDVT